MVAPDSEEGHDDASDSCDLHIAWNWMRRR